MLLCVCLRVHVHICCTYVWKTEVNIRCLPQLVSALSYESGPHIEPQAVNPHRLVGQWAFRSLMPLPSALGLQVHRYRFLMYRYIFHRNSRV